MTEPRTRVRRGKVVEIPEKWKGQVTHPQTIRKRQSKLTRKVRRRTKRLTKGRLPEDRAPTASEWDDA